MTKNKLKKHESCFTEMKTILSKLLIHNHKFLPYKVDLPKIHYPETVVQANKKSPALKSGSSMKVGGICTLKNEISSSKLYDLLINT